MQKDPAREERIAMAIVVDAYSPEEQAMGWYYYLDDKLQFPFEATRIHKRRTASVKADAVVKVIGMAPEEDCEREMLVEIEWDDDVLATPLSQLQPLNADRATQEAVEDWHYWGDRGYEFD